MPPILIIDFETSFSPHKADGHSLKHQTMAEYVHDARTACLGASVRMAGTGSPAYLEGGALGAVLDAAAQKVRAGRMRVSAHNATFDLYVWSRFYPESYAVLREALWDAPERLVDTEHLARFSSSQGGLPPHVGTSIASLGEHFGIQKGDTADAVASGGAALAEYAHTDTLIAERAIDAMLRHWPTRENALSTLHVLMSTPGPETLHIAPEPLQALAHDTPEEAALRKRLRKDETMHALLVRLGVEPQYKTTPSGKRKLALARSDAFMRALLIHESPQVRALAEMRQGAGSSINRTRAQTLLRASAGGTRALPLPVRYYAAHTGRSGGTDGMNVQNFPRGGGHRAALMAPPGRALVVADASQIEVRVLAWLARDEPTLQTFREGRDPYKAFALDLYGLGNEDEVTPEQRRVAKSAVLGLGFGAGPQGFVVYCQTMGVPMTIAEAQHVVAVYRAARPRVPAYWKEVEREARQFCKLRLPTGRVITYPDLGRDTFIRPRPFRRDPHPSKAWHGAFVENCLAAGTLVYTDVGLVPIEETTPAHRIWDGDNYVWHGGLIDQSYQSCIAVDGVTMTPDHKVMTDGGWQAAEACDRYNRASVRAPDSKQTNQPVYSDSVGDYNGSRGGRAQRDKQDDVTISLGQGGDRFSVIRAPGLRAKVYDIRNCGPQHRFVVQSEKGPMLVHNCVQATAAEITLRHHSLDIARRWPVVMVVHDEIVCSVPEGEAEACLADMLDIMSTPPAWCADMPLAAEGTVAHNYGEAK